MSCENIIVAPASQVLIGPYGSAKSAAVAVGFTSGGSTISSANEKLAVMVDQMLTPVRDITTAQSITFSLNLAEITLDNIAKVFDTEADPANGVVTLKSANERYYAMWIDTKGTVDTTTGKTMNREFIFPKVSFNGTGELSMTRDAAQVITLEGKVIACKAADYPTFEDTEAA